MYVQTLSVDRISKRLKSDLFQKSKSVREKDAQFQRETAKDVELTNLSSVILKKWPNNREDVPPSLKQYWSCRDEHTCLDGLLFKGDKYIAPKTL